MTLAEAFQTYVTGMDGKDRRQAAFDFMFMQLDTMRRRGATMPIPPALKPVTYVHAFMDQFSDDEIRTFKPTITAPKGA